MERAVIEIDNAHARAPILRAEASYWKTPIF